MWGVVLSRDRPTLRGKQQASEQGLPDMVIMGSTVAHQALGHIRLVLLLLLLLGLGLGLALVTVLEG